MDDVCDQITDERDGLGHVTETGGGHYTWFLNGLAGEGRGLSETCLRESEPAYPATRGKFTGGESGADQFLLSHEGTNGRPDGPTQTLRRGCSTG